MLVFHEGLPGAGKSYEACVYHILEALKSGRNVVTNIDGINHAKFSELSGIPEKFVEQVLHCFDHADEPDIERRNDLQRQSIISNSSDDSLVVIDEVQDLWPSNRQKMDPDHQKFFTEHRHKGHDVILMGQDRRDCHNVIRRRIQRCIVFTKKTALGMPNSYKWEAFEATTPEKYHKISSGGRSYEKQYFGLYSSHVGTAKNKDTYSDNRVNIFKQGNLIYGAIAFVGVLFFSLKYLFGFFSTPEVMTGSSQDSGSSPTFLSSPKSGPANPNAEIMEQARLNRLRRDSAESHPKVLQSSVPSSVQAEVEVPPLDVFHSDIKKYRPRLAGYVGIYDGIQSAYIELVDSSLHVKDRYRLAAIEALGWTYKFDAAGLHVTKQGHSQTIRPWPIDPYGRSSNHNITSL